MGIDIVQFDRLAKLSREIGPREATLMLGRQGLHYRGKGARLFNRSLRQAGIADRTIDDLVQEDGFAEKAFATFGFGDARALDYSDYEGADYVHDLNLPVASDLHGKFDFIYDGGTIEHVFDVPQALRNVFTMLKPGGVFASANGMNGWWGHGLYQFSAELVYSFWKRTAGCEVLICEALPAQPKFPAVALRDPADLGHRLFGLWKKLPSSRVYLYYAIRKPEDAKLAERTLQSDYVARWDGDLEGSEEE
ncbi:methyltransferase domain-containing protein [Frigidibacter sp. SD6-1]|uniref:methyltransferase domain-containing protein n=1 Tax=Frigidibacter sp. SD6-1 TaxID=3032581 RepID=UPI0024DFD34C|nr:methyltransferase domain-containing protein [Frigidibacter sp. SD6-1]